MNRYLTLKILIEYWRVAVKYYDNAIFHITFQYLIKYCRFPLLPSKSPGLQLAWIFCEWHVVPFIACAAVHCSMRIRERHSRQLSTWSINQVYPTRNLLKKCEIALRRYLSGRNRKWQLGKNFKAKDGTHQKRYLRNKWRLWGYWNQIFLRWRHPLLQNGSRFLLKQLEES